jgi:hypothetical protein
VGQSIDSIREVRGGSPRPSDHRQSRKGPK